MKKILYGMMGVLTTLTVVTASAYALFTAQATISGINFSTTTASLLVGPMGGPTASTFDANIDIDNAYPGYTNQAPFDVENGSPDYAMSVAAQLTAANGWGNGLENAVKVAVTESDATPAPEEYFTLAEWNQSAKEFPGDDLAADETRTFWVHVWLPEDAPNNLAGKSLSDIVFTLTGTLQTPAPSPTPTL